ncbi:hypothetical protein [Rhizobium sp. CNPSo 3490]|uniref:hypothetical protein n=1 Tax=Rhizobium sp. CNPSo 3490 TaxID=3021407 RepID=UPI00254B7C88|nr:hypothetical protein [Rhizobium sp. CNPSo 3490]MDK4733956.1 hypothetical protein [Rhizobium sp. CNPSo 3490]
MSIRLMNAPNNYPYTHGWGLYPQRQSDIDRRRQSAKRYLAVVDGTTNVNPSGWRFAVDTLEVTFRAVAGENSRDWFTLSNHLGQPSRALAHEIFEALRLLKDLDRRSKTAEGVFDKLDEMAASDMLQMYRATTTDGDPRPSDIREGWCHVLWSHEQPDHILVGAIHGSPLEVVSILDRRNPGTRHGVVAAWHVEDPDWAAAQIARTFGTSLDEIGLLRIPATEGFARIKLLAENAVWKTIVRSPWHLDVDEPSFEGPCTEERQEGSYSP